MAKRLTDSRKWYDPWFRKLPPKYKSFWILLLDLCDHGGFWKKDFEMASFLIGEQITEEDALKMLKGRVNPQNDTWHIPKFISFQYGELNPNNRLHLSVIALLEKEGASKGLVSSCLGDKDKDKDKDKDIYKANFKVFWDAYPKKKSKGYAEKVWNKLKPTKELCEKMVSVIGVLKNCEDWKKENGKYIPYPASWLNAKGWEDELCGLGAEDKWKTVPEI